MQTFTDWAADQFIKDGKKMGHTPLLLKSLREETDEQWIERVMPIMDTLQVNFVMQTGEPLQVYDIKKDAVAIFNRLKEKLTPEVLEPSTPTA